MGLRRQRPSSRAGRSRRQLTHATRRSTIARMRSRSAGSVTSPSTTAARRHRDRDARLLDDRPAGVRDDGAQLGVRAGGATRRRRVDPRHRLVVARAVADGPVEQVLERAGERAGVLRGREHHRIGGRELAAQLGDRRREWVGVVVGIEMRERREPGVRDGLDRRRRHGGNGRQDRGVRRPGPHAARDEQEAGRRGRRHRTELSSSSRLARSVTIARTRRVTARSSSGMPP